MSPPRLELRGMQVEAVKRRNRKIRVFPNGDSPLRGASAVLMEIDHMWISEAIPCIRQEDEMD